MGAAAQVLEDFERLVEATPRPGAKLYNFAAAKPKTPKGIAEDMVKNAERESRAYLAKLRESVEGMRAMTFLSDDIWTATARLMSARVTLLEAEIEKNQVQAQHFLSEPNPEVPLPIMRIIIRGLHRVYTTQHSEMVDVYYRTMAAVWDRDPDGREVVGSASTPAEVETFFQQVRGG